MFEDPDLTFRSDVKAVSSQVALFLAIFHGFGESVGVNPQPGPEFAPHFLASRKFSETHEIVVPVPHGGWSDDEKLRAIELGLETGFVEAARSFNARVFHFGMTMEIVEGMVKEMMNKENKLCINSANRILNCGLRLARDGRKPLQELQMSIDLTARLVCIPDRLFDPLCVRSLPLSLLSLACGQHLIDLPRNRLLGTQDLRAIRTTAICLALNRPITHL